MKSVYFKQPKPLTVTILGIVVLVLAFFLVYENRARGSQIVIMSLMSIVLLGYSISYEIKDSLDHRRYFQLLGFSLFSQKLKTVFPDYIVVFSASFKKNSEWGPVSAMGNESKGSTYVIRFFKGNKHFTVWKTNSLQLANKRAKEVGMLLEVEVRLKN